MLARMIDAIELARRLIDIPSVSDSEGAVALELEQILAGLGFQTERQQIDGERFNLFASTKATPRVVLCTHIDTVPPFFSSRDDGDFLYGRGACDTKGILAAMLAAAERLLATGVEEFGFLLVVAEETDSVGAKRANQQFADRGSEYIVVGEPTESSYVHASKGAFTCTLRFEGKAAHSAYPERGDSAIRKMRLALDAIESFNWGSDLLLGNATVNIGVVRGGVKANVIPAEAEADLIFRTVRHHDEMKREVQTLISPFGGMIARSHGNPPTYMVTPEGVESIGVAFNTDVPHLGRMGKPLLFGPGSILDAHAADEKISKKELLAAIDSYESLVRSLLAGEVRTHGKSN